MGIDINLSGVPEFDTLEIVKTGKLSTSSFSFDTGAGNYAQGGTTASASHNLGYVPAVIAYIDGGLVYYPVPHQTIWSISSTGYTLLWVTVSVDKTNITLYVNTIGYNNNAGTISGYDIKYFLFRERSSRT